MVAGVIKPPPDEDRYWASLQLLEGMREVPDGVAVSVPAWVLNQARTTIEGQGVALRAIIAGQGEAPRAPSSTLSGRRIEALARMLSPDYRSELDDTETEETGIRLAARRLVEAIAARALDGQTDGQILTGLRCGDELRRLVVAVILAQEEWTW